VCGWQVKLCDRLVTRGSYLSALNIRSLYIKHYINSAVYFFYYILPKTGFFGYILTADSKGLTSTNLDIIGLRAIEFSKIRQNKGHHAAQGHSRSHVWYQSKAHMQLCVSKSYQLISYLVPFLSYCGLLVKFLLLTKMPLSISVTG